MSDNSKKHLNINTILLTLTLGLLGWGGNKVIEKIDSNNTRLIEVSTSQTFVVQRLSAVENKLVKLVTEEDFKAEINRLQNEVNRLKRGNPQP